MTKAHEIANGDIPKVGDRVELHPATDAWMMGDRFGQVEKVGALLLHVRCDRSGKIRKLHPLNVGQVIR